ncbi:unnamed protein product [Protopolystoma xenopodis]|uniref:Uncharacterized protein n=1 Tax=Protopolystoma xenopodis TaxID=117903 RepID=A0A448XHX7_9PLAT|nr:unnamed protein product [Protopolystoma xenopodis]
MCHRLGLLKLCLDDKASMVTAGLGRRQRVTGRLNELLGPDDATWPGRIGIVSTGSSRCLGFGDSADGRTDGRTDKVATEACEMKSVGKAGNRSTREAVKKLPSKVSRQAQPADLVHSAKLAKEERLKPVCLFARLPDLAGQILLQLQIEIEIEIEIEIRIYLSVNTPIHIRLHRLTDQTATRSLVALASLFCMASLPTVRRYRLRVRAALRTPRRSF